MGKERKIEIDDRIPVVYNASLFPKSVNKTEIWPSILTKALIKLNSWRWSDPKAKEVEVGDGSIIYALTGYIPETINLEKLTLYGTNFYKNLINNSQMEVYQ
jgi:Heterodisulfide reductase, subunit A and related polyferredoxins